ncbi:hypothetical protein [Lysinibacillus sp. RC46]|uniref:hypothetical protein n=1 Tax=Lysinibacillus sp. RC46 TaxID=3156295 RepID=UPI003511C060
MANLTGLPSFRVALFVVGDSFRRFGRSFRRFDGSIRRYGDSFRHFGGTFRRWRFFPSL